MAWPNPNSRFEMSGGRGGVITFVEGDKTGELSWEMLLGEADIGIFADQCRWVDPTNQPMTREQVEIAVQELAADSGMNILLTFWDGERIISGHSGKR